MNGWRFLFFSLFVHLVLWLFINSRPPANLFTEKPVEVTIVEKKEVAKARSDLQHKTVVRQALPPLDMLKPEPPKNPKYLSEQDMNVKKEMKARESGLTENRNQQTARPQPSQKGETSKSETVSRSDEPGFGPKPNQTEKPNPNLYAVGQNLMAQSSTNGEFLPEVADGPITALNSERFVYYSFFARIEERIRPLWERNVHDAEERLPANIQKQVLNHDWITSLEIIIDKQGNYEATYVRQTSGVDEIDRAAIQAFKEVSYFPNPPQGMFESDGRIHLKYAFVVMSNPGFFTHHN